MDNDQAGRKANGILSGFVKTEEDLKLIPMNKEYLPHKDVNAWLMHKLNLKPLG